MKELSEGSRAFSEGSETLFEGHLKFYSSKATFYGRSIFNADVVYKFSHVIYIPN